MSEQPMSVPAWIASCGGAALPAGARGRFKESWWRNGLVWSGGGALGLMLGWLIARGVSLDGQLADPLVVVFALLSAGLAAAGREWADTSIPLGVLAGFTLIPVAGVSATLAGGLAGFAAAWVWAGTGWTTYRGAGTDRLWALLAGAVCVLSGAVAASGMGITL